MITRHHLKALLRLARDSRDAEGATACRSLLDGVTGAARDNAVRRVGLFIDRMRRAS